MKLKLVIFLLGLVATSGTFAQKPASNPNKVSTEVKTEKHLSSSILLWMHTDKPSQAGMDKWKGPHAKIISANKGLWEYRQIHLSNNNTGLWQPIEGVETAITTSRKIDGIADVTLKNIFSIFRGKKQNKLAFADEVNIFKRTILYAAFPKNSRWYKVSQPNEIIEARSIVFFRMKEGVRVADFKKYFNEELGPTLSNTTMLKELRSKLYAPWKQKQWNTPNVAHDNPKELQFQSSLMLGFKDKITMEQFFKSEAVKNFSDRISIFCSAVHAYEIYETLTFVKNGEEISY